MAKQKPKKYLTADDHFVPYWTALGKLVFAWNELHEELGLLYDSILGPATSGAALAAWRVTESDRMQRNMLKYAVEATAWEAPILGLNPKAKDDILWVLEKANSLAEHRNNAVHSPYAVTHDLDTHKSAVVPLDFFGHPRAQKLRGKDLLSEFAWATDRTRALLNFTVVISNMMRDDPRLPWPDRPELPEREPKKSRQDQRRQDQPKQPPRPPRSSPA